MPHPLQNRVDPWSQLHATPSRAAIRMGNRGVLHNKEQEIVRNSQGKAWLCCRLQLNDIHRTVFQVQPTFSYSELFFLDEATALAAGHRPCKDCQPYRFRKFKQAWCSANRQGTSHTKVLIATIDEQSLWGQCGLSFQITLTRLGQMIDSHSLSVVYQVEKSVRHAKFSVPSFELKSDKEIISVPDEQ